MGQVLARVFGHGNGVNASQESERDPLVRGDHPGNQPVGGDPPANQPVGGDPRANQPVGSDPRANQDQSKWALFKAKCQGGWTGFKDCCGWTVGGLYGCSSDCCSWCSGWCAGAGSSLKNWCGTRCPPSRYWKLRKKALASLLETVASTNVMGILSLNIYASTYFIAWAPTGSVCISKGFNTWAKMIVVCLPFTLFPLTLYVAGQSKALQHDLHGIGLVAGAVLLEIVYILCMGGLMTICMSAIDWLPVTLVTFFLSILLFVACGCCCFVPRCLRGCCVGWWFGWLCCQQIDADDEIDLEAALA